MKLKVIRENPWVGLELSGRVSGKVRTSWTPDELERLLAASRPHLRNVLVLGCNTGLRINALINLEWRDVVFSQVGEDSFGEIIVRPEIDKAKKGYRVPLSEACHDLLAHLLVTRHAQHDCVLSNIQGGRFKGSASVREGITVAARKAGLGVVASPCHSLRRTFGRHAVLGHLTGRPVPLYVVSKWMGHSSVAMTEKYLDLDNSTSQGWMAKASAETSNQDPLR